MVRTFLGNIKGDKGDKGDRGLKGDTGAKGDTGEPGGFNDESIGAKNLISISQLIPRGSTATYDYDVDNGLINYSNIEWYLSQQVVLNGVKHVFRVEDYISNPSVRNGAMILMVKDSAGEQIVYENANKKIPVEIDLTGRDVEEYTVELRVTNTTLFSGFIEKPMLVEGEYSVLWSPSTADKGVLKKQNRVTGRFYLPEINNNGSFENLSVYNLTASEFMSVQDGGILFEDGLYLLTNTTNLNQDDGLVTLNVRVNTVSERIVAFPADTSGNFSHMLSLSKGDVLDVRVSYTGTEKGTMPATARNGFTITKL